MSKKVNSYLEYGETPESLIKWLRVIEIERIPLYNQILNHIPPNSNAIEIGAGTSWLSSKLSQNKNIKQIIAVDISFRNLSLAKKYFAPKLSAHREKMLFYESDFHKLNIFNNESIDIVFVDAALHHTKTLDLLLKELYRILKNNGKIIAIREPILPSFFVLRKIKKANFGKKQIAAGDIECIYAKEEWKDYFERNNFELAFYPAFSHSKKDKILQTWPLKWLNGLLFNRYYLIATKK